MKRHYLLLAAMAVLGTVSAQSVSIDWQRNYGGTANDVSTDIIRTSDGGYAVAGYTQSNNIDVVGAISGEDAWVLKLNAAGNIVWKKIFGGSSDDRAHAIIQAANGDLIFAGTTNSGNGNISGARGGYDYFLTAHQSNGSTIY